jgi:hypothetical protein
VNNPKLIIGPAGFGGTGLLFPASSTIGLSFQMFPESYNTGTSFNPAFNQYKETYALDPSYTLGQSFFSSATYNGTNLASQGFTTTGLIGTWGIVGTSETINVFVAPPQFPAPSPCLAPALSPAPARGSRPVFPHTTGGTDGA